MVLALDPSNFNRAILNAIMSNEWGGEIGGGETFCADEVGS